MDNWDELGRLLRQQRMNRNLSCEEMAGHLKISEQFLQSLEEGTLKGTPGIYVRDALKRICRYLEMDCQRVLNLYEPSGTGAKENFRAIARRSWKPIVWWNIIILPVLLGSIGYLGIHTHSLLQQRQPRITNLGSYSIHVRYGSDPWQELGVGQTRVFPIGDSLEVQNPKQNRVLVEFGKNQWRVELEAFIVEWNDG